MNSLAVKPDQYNPQLSLVPHSPHFSPIAPEQEDLSHLLDQAAEQEQRAQYEAELLRNEWRRCSKRALDARRVRIQLEALIQTSSGGAR